MGWGRYRGKFLRFLYIIRHYLANPAVLLVWYICTHLIRPVKRIVLDCVCGQSQGLIHLVHKAIIKAADGEQFVKQKQKQT